MAWKHLFSETAHSNPRSAEDWTRLASPTVPYQTALMKASYWWVCPGWTEKTGNVNTSNIYLQFFIFFLIYLLLSNWTLGMKYPPSVVSLEAILGNPAGTMFPILWNSWMTASVYGMLGLSAIVGWRDCPITLSISAWTFSLWGFETLYLNNCLFLFLLKLLYGIYDGLTTDLELLGSLTRTRDPSAKWWLLFLFRLRSGPRYKYPESQC